MPDWQQRRSCPACGFAVTSAAPTPPKYAVLLATMKLTCVAVLSLLSVALPALAEKKVVQPKEMPGGGPLSAGILAGDTLYVSGQLGQIGRAHV